LSFINLTDADLLREIEGLIPDDLSTAWAYDAQNPHEIEQAV
jgi:hypothetical protein